MSLFPCIEKLLTGHLKGVGYYIVFNIDQVGYNPGDSINLDADDKYAIDDAEAIRRAADHGYPNLRVLYTREIRELAEKEQA